MQEPCVTGDAGLDGELARVERRFGLGEVAVMEQWPGCHPVDESLCRQDIDDVADGGDRDQHQQVGEAVFQPGRMDHGVAMKAGASHFDTTVADAVDTDAVCATQVEHRLADDPRPADHQRFAIPAQPRQCLGSHAARSASRP